jgi:hypothetical protein
MYSDTSHVCSTKLETTEDLNGYFSFLVIQVYGSSSNWGFKIQSSRGIKGVSIQNLFFLIFLYVNLFFMNIKGIFNFEVKYRSS